MIKILVDSTGDCPRENPVCDMFVPLTVTIGGRDYLDGIDLDADRFYELLTTSQEFPKTSQPSPEAFAAVLARSENIYAQAVEKYEQTLHQPLYHLPAVIMGFRSVKDERV